MTLSEIKEALPFLLKRRSKLSKENPKCSELLSINIYINKLINGAYPSIESLLELGIIYPGSYLYEEVYYINSTPYYIYYTSQNSYKKINFTDTIRAKKLSKEEIQKKIRKLIRIQ